MTWLSNELYIMLRCYVTLLCYVVTLLRCIVTLHCYVMQLRYITLRCYVTLLCCVSHVKLTFVSWLDSVMNFTLRYAVTLRYVISLLGYVNVVILSQTMIFFLKLNMLFCCLNITVSVLQHYNNYHMFNMLYACCWYSVMVICIVLERVTCCFGSHWQSTWFVVSVWPCVFLISWKVDVLS